MDIRTEGVQAVLGGSAILKGVDIQVGQRELVGIIGPNGSGKSTLLKCIYRGVEAPPAARCCWMEGIWTSTAIGSPPGALPW